MTAIRDVKSGFSTNKYAIPTARVEKNRESTDQVIASQFEETEDDESTDGAARARIIPLQKWSEFMNVVRKKKKTTVDAKDLVEQESWDLINSLGSS